LRIKSIDFLSSWFLSLFTAIPHMNYDLLTNLVEYYLEVGYTALLSISIGILSVNEQKILTLKHDEILTYLKLDMWKEQNTKRTCTTNADDKESIETKGNDSNNNSSIGTTTDFHRLIAAASKPTMLNQRDMDRMEVEYIKSKHSA
jgi:hypothetical protein